MKEVLCVRGSKKWWKKNRETLLADGADKSRFWVMPWLDTRLTVSV